MILPGTDGKDAVKTTGFRNSTRLDAEDTVKNPFIAAVCVIAPDALSVIVASLAVKVPPIVNELELIVIGPETVSELGMEIAAPLPDSPSVRLLQFVAIRLLKLVAPENVALVLARISALLQVSEVAAAKAKTSALIKISPEVLIVDVLRKLSPVTLVNEPLVPSIIDIEPEPEEVIDVVPEKITPLLLAPEPPVLATPSNKIEPSPVDTVRLFV